MTYVAIPGGFVYLAAILDAWSRKVVGYAISRSMDARIPALPCRAGLTTQYLTRTNGEHMLCIAAMLQLVPLSATPGHVVVPLLGRLVPAGFPSPADDYLEGEIDLSRYLVERPASTFLMRVSGLSMTGAGIMDGDLLVVDRSIEPRAG